MTLEWLESAYHATRKDGAAGIDEVTGKQYAENLEENLRALHERLKSGTYKAPPVRRKHIPKGTSGETRPIGIPAFEDKIVPVVMLFVCLVAPVALLVVPNKTHAENMPKPRVLSQYWPLDKK